MNITGFITAAVFTLGGGIAGVETVQPAIQNIAAQTQLSASITGLAAATSTGQDTIRYKEGMLIVGDITVPNINLYVNGATKPVSPKHHPKQLGADWCAETVSETGDAYHYTPYTQGVVEGGCNDPQTPEETDTAGGDTQ